MNINILLSENIEDNGLTIRKIFNSIDLEDKNVISFYMITFLSILKIEEAEFSLVYQIRNLDNGMFTILDVANYQIHEQEISDENIDEVRKGVITSINSEYYSNVYIPRKGNYQIQVYVLDTNEMQIINQEETKKERRKQIIKTIESKEMIGAYPFVVQ